MLTKASPVTVMDALSLTRQQWAGSGSVLSPSAHQRETPGSQAFSYSSSRPSVSSLLPSLPSPPCCHLTYRPTCLASPLLPNHYDTVAEWLWTGQDFQGREDVERKEHWGGLTGREKVAKSAITLHFQGGEKSHHWLNHLYNIRWFQQFHLMRKSTLSL